MSILDQFGNPIKKKELAQEIFPSTSAVRQTVSATTGIDPVKLGAIFRDSERGDMDAYLAMAEEIEEKDTHYSSVMGTRKRAVAQLEITVEPAGDDKVSMEQAEFIQDWLDRDDLEGETVDILDAIGKGFSATEIIWDTSGDQWQPIELIWRDPRLFKFAPDQRTLMIRGDNNKLEPLPPYKFIVHTHKAKSGTPVRGGVVRPCAWMWLFKNFSVKDWVIFAERYGQPIRIGKYHSGSSDEDKKVLKRAVSRLASDAAAIIPDKMLIEFIDSQDKKSSAEVFENLARFMDEQMSKAVLGQTTTTDAISGGHAVSKEHNEVREDIEKSDAKQLASTLNKMLVRPMIDLNYGVQARYPRIRVGRQEQIDAEKLSLVAERGQKMGIKMSERKLRAKLGLPDPEDEDDILEPTLASSDNQAAAQVTAARTYRQNDAFEDMAEDVAGDYEEIMNPVVSLLEKAASESANYDEFSQRLLELSKDLDLDGVADILAKGSFMANISGQVDAKLEE
tara:strand:+ start:2204 stop:3724 length:1521 start_codon:yes stop_codon:yes gene_type:complete